MRKQRWHRWSLLALLAVLVTACGLTPAPTPEPPTPTPRARAEQIAQMTQVAARITATAEARALPTAVPTPRATAAARPTLAIGQNGANIPKAVPVKLQAGPLPDGWRYEHPKGYFGLTLPPDWEEYAAQLTYSSSTLAIADAETAFAAADYDDLLDASISIGLVTIPPLGRVLSLSDITNAAIVEVRRLSGTIGGVDYQFIRLERVDLNGQPADRHVYQLTYHGQRVQQMQVYIMANNVLHFLSFSSSPDRFEADLPLFDAILASYRVGRP